MCVFQCLALPYVQKYCDNETLSKLSSDCFQRNRIFGNFYCFSPEILSKNSAEIFSKMLSEPFKTIYTSSCRYFFENTSENSLLKLPKKFLHKVLEKIILFGFFLGITFDFFQICILYAAGSTAEN